MKSLPALSLICALAACSPQIGEDYQSAVEPTPPAAKSETRASHEELMDLCDRWGSLARTTMDARQAGVPMRKLMEGMNPAENSSPAMSKIIVLAYESPRYQTEQHQQREITEFENKIYSACLRENNLP